MDGLDSVSDTMEGSTVESMTSNQDTDLSSAPSESDGILHHENEDLQDRVIALEKKVQQQEDEIVCLKSALSDAIRRLNALESGRGYQNNLLPSKPSFRSSTSGVRRSTGVSTSSARDSASTPTRRSASTHNVSTPSRYSPTPSRVVPRSSPSPTPSAMKRYPSLPPAQFPESNGLSPSRRSGSLSSLPLSGRVSPFPMIRHREPSFNHDEGTLRFFLRGRALTFYGPSNLNDYQVAKPGDAPSEKLKLEWVYGYRGRDARSNLYLLPTGEMIYFIAAVVVLYNVEEQMQRHYLGHTDDVKCLAVHPDKITIATGQVAGHDKREGRQRKRDLEFFDTAENWPHIRIWNSVSLTTLRVIGLGDFDRAVACVAFSKADGGQYLVAVDEANEHVISLWDWQAGEKGHRMTETKSSTEAVLVAEFHPCEKTTIVTCGKGHIAFWNFEGGTLIKKTGIFEKYDKPKYVTCLAFNEGGDVISGDSNGNLFVWGRGTNRISQAVLGAHDGGVFSICITKDGHILTGGKDRRIVKWTPQLKRTGSTYELEEQYGPVRMLSQGKGNVILVGTTRNIILQGSIELKFTPIVQGHVEELWGVAPHPNQHQFLTCGYDRSLCLWDTLTHTPIWLHEVNDSAHCVCFHPEGNLLVVGTLGARWLVIDVSTRDLVTTHSDGNEALECLTFSPDGKFLAVGSRDNNIYLYTVTDGGRKYSRVGKCSGHSSFVTHIDWSADSQYMQSNSGDYELLYWNASTCRQFTSASQMRDVKWNTQTCTLGFSVCGIWPEGADGTDINACDRSNRETLVATADDFGKVNLFTYPCYQPKSQGHAYSGHSSHVTNVRFLYDDSRLLTVGGKDTAIMQWEIIG